MRTRLLMILVVALMGFGALVLFRVQQVVTSDKLQWSESQARTVVGSLVEGSYQQTQSLTQSAEVLISQIPNQAHATFSSQGLGRNFQFLAKGFISPMSEWTSSTQAVQEGNTDNWWMEALTASIRSSKADEYAQYQFHFLPLSQNGKSAVAILWTGSHENEWFVAILKEDFLASLMARMSGQVQISFFVNSRGQIVAHPQREYVGTSFKADPLVEEIVSMGVNSNAVQYTRPQGQKVQGVYEQQKSSNLFAVVQTPLQRLQEQQKQMMLQFLILGLGLVMVVIAIVFVIYKPEVIVRGPLPGSVNQGSVSKSDAKEKWENSTKIAASLVHEIRGPLSSILGHAQMLKKSISENPENKTHLDRIEREAREMRELLGKLSSFAGQEKVETQMLSLDVWIQRWLKNFEPKCSIKGIRLVKDIQAVPELRMAPEWMGKAFENIFQNAVDAMERAPKKELTVQLRQEVDQIILSIKDTGEGMDPQVQSQIFDPFFTTRSQGHHMGLGLSTALGIVKESGGGLQVQSQLGQGTLVRLSWPVPSASPAAEKPAPVSMKSAVAQPLKTPPLPAVAEKKEIILPAQEEKTSVTALISTQESEPLQAVKQKIANQEPAVEKALELLDQSPLELIDETPEVTKSEETHLTITDHLVLHDHTQVFTQEQLEQMKQVSTQVSAISKSKSPLDEMKVQIRKPGQKKSASPGDMA